MDVHMRAAPPELRKMRVTNATVKLMNAEQLAFPNASFDAVLCSYALWFFPHVERAVAEFQRVLPLQVFLQ